MMRLVLLWLLEVENCLEEEKCTIDTICPYISLFSQVIGYFTSFKNETLLD